MIQPYTGKCNAHQKDKLELKLHTLVCSGRLGIQEAQDIIYYSWEDAYRKYINPAGCR